MEGVLSERKTLGENNVISSPKVGGVQTPSKMEREVLSILLAQGSKTPARIGDEMRRDRTEVRSVLKSLRKSGKADCVGEDEENDDDESVWFLTTGYLNDLLSRESSRGVQSEVLLEEVEEVDVDFEEDDVDVIDEVDVVEEDDVEDGGFEVGHIEEDDVEVIVIEEDDDIKVQEDDDEDHTDINIVKVSTTQRRRKIIDSSSSEDEPTPRRSTHTKKTKPRRRIIDSSSSSEDEAEETPRRSTHTKKTKRRIIDSSSSSEDESRSKPYESEEEEEFEFNTSSSSSSSPSLLQLSNDLAAEARTKSLGGFIVSDDDFSEEESYIKDTDDDDSSPVKIANELDVHPKIYSRLYKHQVEGLEWMWKLWNRSQDAGGILADDMGLGKTVRSVLMSLTSTLTSNTPTPKVQAATFLSAMMKAKHVKRALVVVPVAVMPQWLESLRT